MQPIRLISGFLTVGLWTMLSRVLGFCRDILIAALLGTGPVAEAFLIAFSLPNLFRRFFAEGAFNMAFVPMFSKKLEAGEDAKDFAQDTFVGMIFLLTGLTVIGILVMPLLVTAMASGFRSDMRFELAVSYGRVVFPYILFISLGAMLSGILNATGRFMAAAAAPLLLNVVFIISMLTAWRLDANWIEIGWWMAWGVPVAGVAQLSVVYIAAKRAGFAMKLKRPRMSPDLKKLAIIAAPAALAGGVVQINLLVGRQVASFYDGAVAWLSYADRLYQLPLGVVGIAVGIVLLPDLSRRLSAGDAEGGNDAFNRAAEFSLALTIPAAVALVVIPSPLVNLLFQRGAFGPEDTAATALAVAVYGLGLPAFVLQKALQPLYFAREDTRTPFRYALWAMVVNAALAIGLSPVIGFIAAAFATTMTGWAMVGMLWIGSRKMDGAARLDDRFIDRVFWIVLSSMLMGIVLWGFQEMLRPLFVVPRVRHLAMIILIASGIVSYFAIGQILGAFRLQDFRKALKRSG